MTEGKQIRSDLVDAIRDKHLVRLRHGGLLRFIEPHVYGRNEAGDELLHAWQVEGGSGSGERHGWKLFRVDEISSISVLAEHFLVGRPGYTRDHKEMAVIYAQL
jgi:hypothetical protein